MSTDSNIFILKNQHTSFSISYSSFEKLTFSTFSIFGRIIIFSKIFVELLIHLEPNLFNQFIKVANSSLSSNSKFRILFASGEILSADRFEQKCNYEKFFIHIQLLESQTTNSPHAITKFHIFHVKISTSVHE